MWCRQHIRLLLPLATVVLAAQEAWLRTGAEAFRSKNWAVAERTFAARVSAHPEDALAHKWLGMTYAAQQKFLLAEPPFAKACQKADADSCYYWGRTLYSLSRFEPALAAYAKAPKNGRTMLGMALAYEALGRDADAERAYKQALDAGDKQAAADYERFQRKQKAPAVMPSPEIRFEARDLPFTVRNGAQGKKHLPETMIAGIAVLDFDNDGWPDLFIANGAGQRGGLLRNNGNGTFTLRGELSGEGDSMGVAAADFDNDGWTDLFLTGVRGNRLYRNNQGNFEDVTTGAGVRGDGQWSVAAAWLDFDDDGLLDLFVARYVQYDAAREPYCGTPAIRQYCHPREFQALTNVLYRNLGNRRFQDVSETSGIGRHRGKGMGVAVGDYDGDGRLDVFVANDTVPNFLFHNLGAGRFEEVAAKAGVAYGENGEPVSSMGAELRDYDNDGREDLWVTALSNEMFPLFRNLGRGAFEDVTLASGVAKASLPWAGWSNAIADFNNDGWKDLFAANGHVMDNAELTSGRQSRQPNLLLTNGRTAFAGRVLGSAAMHRGLVAADFDHDGRVDLAVTRLNEPAQVWWNRTSAAGNWIAFQLQGASANRDAIGALVQIEAASGKQWNRVPASAGYGAGPERVVRFGLGSVDAIKRVVVTWPGGSKQEMQGLAAGRIHTIKQP